MELLSYGNMKERKGQRVAMGRSGNGSEQALLLVELDAGLTFVGLAESRRGRKEWDGWMVISVRRGAGGHILN